MSRLLVEVSRGQVDRIRSSTIDKKNELLDKNGCEANFAQRFARREEDALGEAIERFGPFVRSICQRICSDDLIAEGVVSTVFWEIWTKTEAVDVKGGALLAYLCTLARSRALDQVRKQAAIDRLHQSYFDEHRHGKGVRSKSVVSKGEIQNDSIAKVLEVLQQLPPIQSKTIGMAFLEGASHREIAVQLGIPLGTVKTCIRRGLSRLRGLLDQELEIENK